MAHEVQLDVSVMFLPHLDIYDLLLERPVAMWNIFVFTIKKQDVVVNGDIYASALWQIVKMCVGFSLLYKNFHSPVFFFFFYFVIVSLLLFSQCQLLFLAPFLPITYCNSLEKWGPCGNVFEKEANKEKVKTNGNKLTCPVPPLPPTLVLQMPVRHSSP